MASLEQFAYWRGGLMQSIHALANIVAPEPWGEGNYLLRLYVERTIAIETNRGMDLPGGYGESRDARWRVYPLGLWNVYMRGAFAVFERNWIPNKQPWVFIMWATEEYLPGICQPCVGLRWLEMDAELTLDPSLNLLPLQSLNVNPCALLVLQQIFGEADDYGLLHRVNSALVITEAMARRNPRLAVPCLRTDIPELLLPVMLSCSAGGHADLALVVRRVDYEYIP